MDQFNVHVATTYIMYFQIVLVSWATKQLGY